MTYWSLFSRWENLSTPTGRRSERTCYLAWSSLLTNTNHVWGHWISFILSGLSSVGMSGFFQRLNKLRCVTVFWWFACCGSFCVGFTVRFVCCGWLCLWGCFTWNVVVCLVWLLWFCGLGLCCLSGWMSGLVVFGVGWCFTWNISPIYFYGWLW